MESVEAWKFCRRGCEPIRSGKAKPTNPSEANSMPTGRKAHRKPPERLLSRCLGWDRLSFRALRTAQQHRLSTVGRFPTASRVNTINQAITQAISRQNMHLLFRFNFCILSVVIALLSPAPSLDVTQIWGHIAGYSLPPLPHYGTRLAFVIGRTVQHFRCRLESSCAYPP